MGKPSTMALGASDWCPEVVAFKATSEHSASGEASVASEGASGPFTNGSIGVANGPPMGSNGSKISKVDDRFPRRDLTGLNLGGFEV